MKELPSLGFIEAVKLASSRILEFKGRSRRSEFWWWMLVVIITNWVITAFASSLLVSAIMSIIIMFFGLVDCKTQARVPSGFTLAMGWGVQLN